LLDNNNNNEVNESGYLDEDGNFVPNNNCHHYVVDEDGEINYYRNDRGYFSE
jgi:hypothetical protein